MSLSTYCTLLTLLKFHDGSKRSRTLLERELQTVTGNKSARWRHLTVGRRKWMLDVSRPSGSIRERWNPGTLSAGRISLFSLISEDFCSSVELYKDLLKCKTNVVKIWITVLDIRFSKSLSMYQFVFFKHVFK